MQKQNQLDSVHKKVFGKQKEYDIIDVYHHLMIHYGYIPFEEFKKMDASLVDGLMHRINKMNEKESSTGKRGKF